MIVMERILKAVIPAMILGAVIFGCGPGPDEVKPVQVTPVDGATGGTVSGTDRTSGGDFGGAGAGTITPGKEDAPTPEGGVNTPGNEMPADAK